MKKIYISRCLKLSALFIPLIVVLLFLQAHIYCYFDHNTERISHFYYEEENSLDVVFMGASEVMAGYVPGYAYSEYGYTSYNYCMDANTGALYLSQLKEVLAHQNPQLIVIETYGFYGDAERLHSEARYRMYAESIPLSMNKIETIMDMEYEDKASMFLPFIKYHGHGYFALSQLNHIVRGEEFDRSPSVLKGVLSQTTLYSGPDESSFVEAGSSQLSELSRGYLVEFLSYCKEQNLDNIVFVNFPRILGDAPTDNEVNAVTAFVEEVKEIVLQYGYPYIDLQERTDAVTLDFSTDFYNPHHMNTYGSKKVTHYLGKIIVDEYGVVPMTQSPENKAMWENTALYSDKYFAWADRCIKNGINNYADEEWHVLRWIDEG